MFILPVYGDLYSALCTPPPSMLEGSENMNHVLPLFTKSTVMPVVITADNSIHWHEGITAKRSVSLYCLSRWIFWLYIFHIPFKHSNMQPGIFAVSHNVKCICTLCAHLYTNVTVRSWIGIHFLLGVTTAVWPHFKISWLQRTRYNLFWNARMESRTKSVTLCDVSDHFFCSYNQSDDKKISPVGVFFV